MLLLRLLLLLLLQELGELGLLQGVEARLGVGLSLRLKSCLRRPLGLLPCIRRLEESAGVLSAGILTHLRSCQALRLLLLQQRGLLLPHVEAELSEATHG